MTSSDLYIKASLYGQPDLKDVNGAKGKKCHAPLPPPKVFDVRPSVKLAPDKNNIRERGEGVALLQCGKVAIYTLTLGQTLYRSLPMPKVRDSRRSIVKLYGL